MRALQRVTPEGFVVISVSMLDHSHSQGDFPRAIIQLSTRKLALARAVPPRRHTAEQSIPHDQRMKENRSNVREERRE